MNNNEIQQVMEKRKETFVNDIKVDSKVCDSVIKKKIFLKELEGNEELLNMLSVNRLKKLDKYYDSIIEQNNAKIKKLKNS